MTVTAYINVSAISTVLISAMKETVDFFLFFVVVSLGFSKTESLDDGCSVGDIQNLSSTINSYPAKEIYLNTGSPSTCAGVLYNVTYCYLVPVDSGDEINKATFALWAPTGNNTYKQVTESQSDINFNNDGCDDKGFTTLAKWSNPGPNQAEYIYCRTRCFDPPLAITQGYVFGLNLESNDISKRIFIADTSSQSISGDEVCIASQLEDSNEEYTCDNGAVYDNITLLLHATVYHCYPLPAPTNGSINTTITFDSTIVSFTCNDQFIISPPLVLKCVGTEWRLNDDLSTIWDNSIPSCVPAYCSHPPDDLVEHASIINDNETQYSNGSIVTFTCDTGYHFYYSSTIDYQCIHGAWQTTINYRRHFSIGCYPHRCPLPDDIDPHGHLLLTSNDHTFSVNTTVRFSCDDGYILSFTNPLLCLSNGTWNSSSPQCYVVIEPTGPETAEYAISDGYRLLIASAVVVVFVLLLTVICLLIVFLARKRGQQTTMNHGTSTLDQNGSLKQHLIPNDTPQANNDDEISPYSYVKMPMQVYVSAKDGTVTYINRPLSSNYSSPPPSIMSSHQSVAMPVFMPPAPLTLVSNQRHSGLSTMSMSPPLGNPLEELEQSLKSENPYWSPSTVTKELYLQLDQIKVKTIPEKNVRILDELGSGEFSTVYKGVLVSDYDSDDVAVAIKSTKQNDDEEERAKFLREAAIMGQFNHSNVLKLFGVVVDKPDCTLIVVEYMSKGDLLSHLQQLKSSVNDNTSDTVASTRGELPKQLLNFTRQICLGMVYLSGKGFVHRDLAARNILVSADDICKIADFGLSRGLDDESYYIVHEGAVIPVKWTAPEAIQQRKYSVASDVWSYGCTLYEIWSMGCKPFKGASTMNAIKIIKTGQRLTPPPGCPREIYHTMIKTWHPNPKERPSFNDIMLMLIKNDDQLLKVPDNDEASSPQANQLGSDLKNGINLYVDLQNIYLNK